MSLMGELKVEGVEGLYPQVPHQDLQQYDPYYNNYYGGDYNNVNYYQVMEVAGRSFSYLPDDLKKPKTFHPSFSI